ncbi:MAG: hemerythrin family protein [Gammaproteobacteria bacterium]|nr:hemerythrin family protein [Gammaproteobacteria bacterium]MCP5424173.1 hemerythrin family protein [Gammaproteobacteria bacterium]MCP5458950.1 hemerythrin family protein [Gammaproteobacteria bacterium]
MGRKKCPAISVGCTAIDAEHEMQLGMLEELQHAIAKGRRKSKIEGLLTQLICFTMSHHQSEQLLMRLYAFPGYAAHSDEHQQLIERLKKLRRQFRNDEVILTAAWGETVEEWLLDHIRGADAVLGKYLCEAEPVNPMLMVN